jgi:3-methyl-2-oxobutanoate hydroxymethyltransferase
LDIPENINYNFPLTVTCSHCKQLYSEHRNGSWLIQVRKGAVLNRNKVSIQDLQYKKNNSENIVMVTAYDYPSSLLADSAGVDVILVGDSLGMVVLGYDSTVPVTMDEMLHHCRAAARGNRRAFTVGDMPFGSYHSGRDKAVSNAVRFLKEGGMDSVKLEGGKEMADIIRAIIDAGIPVMGHLGLTPQSISKLGGYNVQGNNAEDAWRIYKDALILEKTGCFAVVLESIPAPLGKFISSQLKIPTIGIGAGNSCSGQVLVYHDLLGIYKGKNPRFVKTYNNLADEIRKSLRTYCDEVRSGSFPEKSHSYKMDKEEWKKFQLLIKQGQ